jgi:hypothetical protein
MSVTDEDPLYRNLVDLDDRVGEIAESGMAVKISLERYRMFFVPGTLAQERSSHCLSQC